MHKFWVLVMCLFVTYSATASNAVERSKLTNKQKDKITSFIKQQTKYSSNVPKSISNILKRYPEQVDVVLPIALDLYPRLTKQIIRRSIEAEAALACDVVTMAINSKLISSADAIQVAVEVAPAYASDIIKVVAEEHSEQLEEIVRVAIATEPAIGDYVVKSAMESFPNQMLEVLAGAIQALPDSLLLLLKDTLSLFPGQAEAVVETAVSNNKHIANRRIIDTAVANGMPELQAIDAALAGGAKITDIAKK